MKIMKKCHKGQLTQIAVQGRIHEPVLGFGMWLLGCSDWLIGSCNLQELYGCGWLLTDSSKNSPPQLSFHLKLVLEEFWAFFS